MLVPGSMDVDSSDALQRVLAVLCGYSNTQPRFNAPEGGCSCVDVLERLAGTQVVLEVHHRSTAAAGQCLWSTLQVAEKLGPFRPTFLHIYGPHNGV